VPDSVLVGENVPDSVLAERDVSDNHRFTLITHIPDDMGDDGLDSASDELNSAVLEDVTQWFLLS